jgi:hypothetical protein
MAAPAKSTRSISTVAQGVRKAQWLPDFRERLAKLMHPLPSSEANRKALTERIEVFLARAELGLDKRQTEILRTIFSAPAEQAECSTFDPAIIVLFPKWVPFNKEWLLVL